MLRKAAHDVVGRCSLNLHSDAAVSENGILTETISTEISTWCQVFYGSLPISVKHMRRFFQSFSFFCLLPSVCGNVCVLVLDTAGDVVLTLGNMLNQYTTYVP